MSPDDPIALDDAELALVEQAMAGSLAPVPPDPAVRARLLANVEALVQPGRLDRHAARLAALYDVTVDKARMFLGWVDQPDRWMPSPAPGVTLVHLSPGPTWAALDCGLVRVPAGARFPWHVHDGQEVTVVLSGQARYSDGRVLSAGDELVIGDAAEHDFVVDPDEDYVFAVRFGAVRPATPPPGH